jgi:hypothetical protein
MYKTTQYHLHEMDYQRLEPEPTSATAEEKEEPGCREWGEMFWILSFLSFCVSFILMRDSYVLFYHPKPWCSEGMIGICIARLHCNHYDGCMFPRNHTVIDTIPGIQPDISDLVPHMVAIVVCFLAGCLFLYVTCVCDKKRTQS